MTSVDRIAPAYGHPRRPRCDVALNEQSEFYDHRRKIWNRSSLYGRWQWQLWRRHQRRTPYAHTRDSDWSDVTWYTWMSIGGAFRINCCRMVTHVEGHPCDSTYTNWHMRCRWRRFITCHVIDETVGRPFPGNTRAYLDNPTNNEALIVEAWNASCSARGAVVVTTGNDIRRPIWI